MIVAGCLFVLPAMAMAAPFQNGSFEDSPIDPGNAAYCQRGDSRITGWTVLDHSIDYIGKENAASEGSRSIDLV
ncbi:MAG TPA: PEP-CTERM sorting domain-containing protein, partial [Polyangia bacterium]